MGAIIEKGLQIKQLFSNGIRRWKHLFVGISLITLVTAAYQSPLLIETQVNIPEKISEQRHGVTQLDYLDLPPGSYYFSLGRPHGRCAININNDIYAKNYSDATPVRSSLTLGFPLTIEQSSDLRVEIRCESQDTSKASFNHKPVLAKFYPGFFLHALRVFTYIYLGPIAAALIIIGVLLASIDKDRRVSSFSFSRIDWRLLLFGLSGFLYAMSLAHFPRMFSTELISATGHVVLRHVFSICFLFLIGKYAAVHPFWVWTHLISVCVTFYVYFDDPGSLFTTYQWQVLIFPASSIFCFWKLSKDEAINKSHDLMKYVAATWILNQIFDVANLWFRFGPYNSPALLATMCGLLFLVKMEERKRRDLMIASQQRILNLTRMSSDPGEVLRAIASELRGTGGFVRASAYIDRYVLGGASSPKKELERVFEVGYTKDTSADWKVLLDHGRGAKMKSAMDCKSAVLSLGADDEWFINIGLEHACINLSISGSKSSYLANDALELIVSIRPSLNDFESRLLDIAIKSRLAMHRVRATRGHGTWTIFAGAIFIDVVGYSTQSSVLGNQYVRFIRSAYLDSMFKRVSPFAQVELTIGDEVYLSVLPDFLPTDLTVSQATSMALSVLHDFVRQEGADLARSHGFTPPLLRIGADIGDVELVVSETDVVTLGQPVNFAKRLQSASKMGEMLVSTRLAAILDPSKIVLGPERRILEKGDVIQGRSLMFRYDKLSAS